MAWVHMHRARVALIVSVVAALSVTVGAAPGWASGGQALVYDNGTVFDPGFKQFANATGNTVVTQKTLPSDLGSNACVLLDLNQVAFTPDQVSTLASYLAGGGSVMAIGDWGGFAGAADSSLNALIGSLGGHMTLNGDLVDVGFGATTLVDSSPLTAGVSSIADAAASTITVSNPATSLVRSRTTGAPVVAAESLGGGRLTLLGDSNIVNDGSAGSYGGHDNGALMRNLCPGEQLHVTGQPVSATEGQSFEGTVATVSGDPDSAPSDYAVSIDWGDGSTSSGSIDASGNVTATHTYGEEGTYTATTAVTDIDSPSNTASDRSTATIADAPLSVSGKTMNSLPSFSGPVASFTDANPTASASDFTATVNWGDGTSSDGTVTANTGGGFDVSGSHAYAQSDLYTVRVEIVDHGGSTAEGTSQLLIYQFAAGNGGSFVIGDGSAALGSRAYFWGSQWAANNSLSSGWGPASFKGFGSSPSSPAPACGGSFATGPGSSSNPPATVPAYLGVYVSSKVSKQGSQITGNLAHIVIVRTDSGYGPDPSQLGSGQVVTRLC